MRGPGAGPRRPGRRPDWRFVFWAVLWLAISQTAALVWLLTVPAGAPPREAWPADLYQAATATLRVWAAVAWAVVILAGVRLLRRP